MSSLIRPEIKLVRAFMSVLVTSNFDDDSIKNKQASMEAPFPHYKSIGNFSDAQGQLTPQSVVRSCQNSNSFEVLCMSSLSASIKRIGLKATEKRWRHQLGLSVAMDTRVLIQSASKYYVAFLHPSDVTHKIGSRLANWPQRYSSSKV